jgi:hypothetical protein
MRTPGVADKMLSSASDFTRPGVEYVLRNAFDGIWSRDGLEKKYRSLVVISWVHRIHQRGCPTSDAMVTLLTR